MPKMNPVIHFEMPYVDGKRLANFYTEVFGWQMVNAGEMMGNYMVATTGESTDKGPTKPGFINGGFFVKSDDPGKGVPSVVISVEDIKEAMKKVKAAGGTIHGEPVDIPGIGWWVSFTDTEGNRASLLQAARS